MAEHFGFLNSGTTEELKRKYQDIDFAWMLSLFTGGQGYVSGYMDQLEVVDASTAEDMQVKVKSGAAWLGEPAGWWFINSDDKILKLDNTELSLGETRVDRVVIKLNRDTEELNINLEIRKGPFTDDFPEKLSTTDGRTHEISLANVVVTGESSAITITDERNSEYCGVVKFGGSSVGSSSASLILENPSPIKAEDNVAGNLLSWIEETSMWEKREFGQPYDGANIILPGGKYIEEGAFTGVEGKRLYRQEDKTFNTDVRDIQYYIGYALDENTALIGLYGGIDKAYNEGMILFYVEPSVSGGSRLKWTKPLDADGVIIRRSTSAYDGSEISWGDLVVNTATDYDAADEWYEDTSLEDETEYFYKAFPYKGTVYNIVDGHNEDSCKAGGLKHEWTFASDTISGTTVGDTASTTDLTSANVTYEESPEGDATLFNGTNSKMDTSSGIINTIKSACTIVAKIHPRNASETRKPILARVYDKTGIDGTNYGISIYLNSSYQVVVRQASGGSWRAITFTDALEADDWSKLIFRLNGYSISLEVNGVNQTNVSGTYAEPSISTYKKFHLGKIDDGVIDDYGNIKIDRVSIYNRVLDSGEV